jgi:hypothetical protein
MLPIDETVIDGPLPRAVTIPLMANIRTFHDLPSMRRRAARRNTLGSRLGCGRGSRYDCAPGLLTDERIAAQVLGLHHERFIHQLVHFVTDKDTYAGRK